MYNLEITNDIMTLTDKRAKIGKSDYSGHQTNYQGINKAYLKSSCDRIYDDIITMDIHTLHLEMLNLTNFDNIQSIKNLKKLSIEFQEIKDVFDGNLNKPEITIPDCLNKNIISLTLFTCIAEKFDYTYLENLSLYNVDIQNVDFSNLTNLNYFSIESCKFNPIVNKLPVSVEVIYVQKCEILPVKLLDLSTVRLLDLSYVDGLKVAYIINNRVNDIKINTKELMYVKACNNSHENDSLMSFESNSKNLYYLNLGKNKIKNLKIDTVEVLDLHDNDLVENFNYENFNKLTKLNLEGNKITNISQLIKCETLEELNIKNTEVKRIPLMLLHSLKILENSLNIDFNEFNIDKFTSDKQNVHTSFIQKNLLQTIDNLHENKNLINDIITYIKYDPYITEEVKDIINIKMALTEKHSTLRISYTDVLVLVFSEVERLVDEKKNELNINSSINISKHDNLQEYNVRSINKLTEYEKDIKNIINEEILRSKEVCFTGNITNLLNSLSSISDKVIITKNENEIISHVVVKCMSESKLKGQDLKDYIKEELLKENVSEKKINEWLNEIE